MKATKREIGTAWAKVPNCRRYVRMISPNIPLCDLASLNWVSHRVPSSPAYARKQKGKELLVTEVDTHTHDAESGAHVACGNCFLWFLQEALAVSCCVPLEDVEAH